VVWRVARKASRAVAATSADQARKQASVIATSRASRAASSSRTHRHHGSNPRAHIFITSRAHAPALTATGDPRVTLITARAPRAPLLRTSCALRLIARTRSALRASDQHRHIVLRTLRASLSHRQNVAASDKWRWLSAWKTRHLINMRASKYQQRISASRGVYRAYHRRMRAVQRYKASRRTCGVLLKIISQNIAKLNMRIIARVAHQHQPTQGKHLAALASSRS